MITIIKEAIQDNDITTLKIQADCKTYEQYHGDDDLQFEMEIDEPNVTDIVKEGEPYYEEGLGQTVSVVSADISESHFDSDDNPDSGIIVMIVKVRTESAIEDKYLNWLAESMLEDITDRIRVRVTGTSSYTEYYPDFSRSDYLGERETSVEVDEMTSLSRILENITCQRL